MVPWKTGEKNGGRDERWLLSKFRKSVALLLFAVLFLWQSKAAQNTTATKPDFPSPGQDIKMLTIGERIMSSGRHGAFRIYEASDGTRATVSYASFESPQAAKAQMRLWLRSAKKTIRWEEKKDQRGQVVGERALAVAKDAKSNKKLFLIIRRDTLNCYIIDSLSLPVAEQVEKLIGD
jgi:hypothetical protein